MKKVKKRLKDWFKKESVSSEKETKNNNVIAKLNMVLFTIVCLIIVVNILTKTKCIPLTAGADNVYDKYASAVMYANGKDYDLSTDEEIYIVRRIGATAFSGKRLLTGKLLFEQRKKESGNYYLISYNKKGENSAELVIDNKKDVIYIHPAGESYYKADYNTECKVAKQLCRQIEAGNINKYVKERFE